MLIESLGFNLMSVSMLCDLNMIVIFGKYHCLVLMESNKSLVFEGYRKDDLYMVDFSAGPQMVVCLLAKASECWLWHQRLGHAGMRNLHTLAKKKHVVGIKGVKFRKDNKSQASLEDNHDYISTFRAATHGLIWPYTLLYSQCYCLSLWLRHC